MDNQQAQTLILERMNLMLQHERINQKYQSFPTEEEAEKWLTLAAIATLYGERL